ncbi:hypothetical protein [Phaeovulum sp. W22_SRMD_FR3]|uniref:hypothetical protein n=1 Tax=Phaeovulum sp. W22_SRMD_FR3 TaxID=3240274 RepID=UPI003F9562E2
MTTKSSSSGDKTQADARDARLRAALRANLQRRKAQARARAADDAPETEGQAGAGTDFGDDGQSENKE